MAVRSPARDAVVIDVPGFGELPVARRLRALGLMTVQRVLAGHGAAAAAVSAHFPDRAQRLLRGLVAPVRLGAVGAGAQVPLEALDDLARSASPNSGSAGGNADLGGDPDLPAVSIVIPTYGKLAHTDLCLAAVRAMTSYPDYEIVVVDNASSDGTPAALQQLASDWAALRVVRNRRNRGFAAAVNQGVRHARGEWLVIMNNDTVVTPGWLSRLVTVAQSDERIAWVGPVTNDSGDLATVPASYRNLQGMLEFARTQVGRPDRVVTKLSLFCALVRRASFEAVGGLDESYGLGMFEDDDLCESLRAAGHRVILASSIFVHHHGGASFRPRGARDYVARFEVNRHRFERKWGRPWCAHLP